MDFVVPEYNSILYKNQQKDAFFLFHASSINYQSNLYQDCLFTSSNLQPIVILS